MSRLKLVRSTFEYKTRIVLKTCMGADSFRIDNFSSEEAISGGQNGEES